MSRSRSNSEKQSRNAVLDCLTSVQRRHALQVLAEEEGAVTERELAEELGATTPRPAVEGAASATIDRIHIRLRHVALPMLAEAGLVTWDADDAIVTTTDHPILEDPLYELLVEADDDRRVEAIVDDRRREVLAVLEERGEAVACADLARAVVARDADGDPSPVAARKLQIQLHHVHLPKLDRAGLVEYDDETGTVVYRGPGDLLDGALGDDPAFRPVERSDSNPPIRIP